MFDYAAEAVAMGHNQDGVAMGEGGKNLTLPVRDDCLLYTSDAADEL